MVETMERWKSICSAQRVRRLGMLALAATLSFLVAPARADGDWPFRR